MQLYANAGASLRKHNFSFGFEDSKRQNDDKVNQQNAAQKSIYEQTQKSQENIGAWRKEQLTKNRTSNIQWGLKAEAPVSFDTTYGDKLSKRSTMNQTFSNLKSGSNDVRRDANTIDSSRTAKNATNVPQAREALNKSLDMGAARGPAVSYKDIREQGALLLNRGGKRIDMHHAQKQTIVGAHIINENSHDPVNLEKGKLDRSNIQSKAANLIQTSNVQLSHLRSSSGLKMNTTNDRSRFGKSANKAAKILDTRALTYDSIGDKGQTGRQSSKPAAGSANLMSPQVSTQDTLGANKRIRDDMISKWQLHFYTKFNHRVFRE